MEFHDLIDVMNSDLENEWMHLTFYTKSSALVRGLHRLAVSSFLVSQAESELKHVMAFSKKIVSLGGDPTEGYLEELNYSTAPEDIIAQAIEMEQQVVINYTHRKNELEILLGTMEENNDCAKRLAQVQDLILFYEEQIEDSHRDLDELRQMI